MCNIPSLTGAGMAVLFLDSSDSVKEIRKKSDIVYRGKENLV